MSKTNKTAGKTAEKKPRKCIDTSAYIALMYKLKNPSAVPQNEDTTTYRVVNNDGTFSRLTLSNNGRHTIITPFIGRCFHKTVESAAEAAFKAIEEGSIGELDCKPPYNNSITKADVQVLEVQLVATITKKIMVTKEVKIEEKEVAI